ncbi:MAG TPA: GAF domain-containing protein [Chloroflexia bacterium]|nr:GAF domain-containing protein [Chloroflexia bacterium]
MTPRDVTHDPGFPEPMGGAGARQIHQLLALNRAAVAITGEIELDPLLQRILDVARELVGCHYAALGVLGPDGYIARFPTSGISREEREQLGAPPRGHGLLGVMLRAGRSLRIPDISRHPQRAGFPPHHPPMTSLLGVPIFVRGALIGDLYLTDKIGGPEFSEEDEWIVELLAGHAATALTNAQLHAENQQALASVRREHARFQALYQVTRAVGSSVHLDEVIRLIVESAVDLLGAAGAAVYLLEEGGRVPGRVPAGGGVPERRFVARYAVGLEDLTTQGPAGLPMARSIAGRAVQTRQTQVVDDTDDEPDIRFPRLTDRELRSLVAVPLVAGAQMLGVLSAYSDRPAAFDPEAVQLLEAFGAAAGTAIHNATLYEAAEAGRAVAEHEQQRLRELESMKDEFLSTAAHELRTPLTTIRMSAGLAHEQLQLIPGLDPRLQELTALVVEGSARMQALVNDLLDLTRLEQGRTTFVLELLDLRDVASAAVTATRPLFASKDQPITMHVPEVSCGVRGDRARLEQVVINLLSNAHKYAPAGAQVDVRVTRAGDECHIRVRDSGPGVPADEREHIFERFYRSSAHRTDRTASTGLGLPIARTVAELHGGRLWAEEAPGGGSIFILALPLVQAPRPAHT